MKNPPPIPHADHCCYCERGFVYEYSYPRIPTWEHLIPVSQGGSDHISNLRTCCNQCNKWRGNKTLDDWKTEIQRLISRGWDFGTFRVSDMEKMVVNIEHIREAIRNATPEMFRFQ